MALSTFSARVQIDPGAEHCIDPELSGIMNRAWGAIDLDFKTRYGLLRASVSESDLIGRFLARYGEWAWDEVCFASSLVQPGGRVLDGGAFLGTFGLGLMQRKRIGFVCFVEGNGGIIHSLEDNIKRNAKAAYAIEAGVLAGENGYSRSILLEEGNIGATSFAPSQNIPAISAGQLSLRGLRQQYGDFDLVKLDIEGLEADVLRSDLDFVTTSGASFLVECNETSSSIVLGQLLLSTGLPLYYFAFPSFNPKNFRGSRKPIFEFAYEADLVLAPREAPILSPRLRQNDCILRRIENVCDLKRALWETPRFGLPGWRGNKTAVEAALAGRKYLSQEFETFLPKQKTIDCGRRE